MCNKLTQSTITPIILIHRTLTINRMLDSQLEMSSQTKSMEQMLLSRCTSPLWWRSWHGHHFSCRPGLLSSQITLFTTHGKRELSPPCSEESMPSEDTQQVKRDVLLANFVRLLAQLLLLSSSLSQDQMAPEELPSMISIWPSAFSAVSARRLAQSMLLLKDPISSTPHFYMRNYFMIRRNFLKTVTNGSHSLPESWRLRQKLDDSH